mgnify:CR=1 FL=1
MNWYVLKMRSSQNALRFRSILTAMQCEFFLPVVTQVVRRGGVDEPVEKPLLFNYVFLRTTEHEALQFVADNIGIVLLRVKLPEGQYGPYMIVPDYQMDSFIRAVGYYTDNVPFVSPTADMLLKGDRVRILGGPFKGVEGLLEAQQGKDGGRVIVRITDLLAVPTLEIDPSLIQVLEFAPVGKHLYKKLDSFEPRLYKAIECRLHHEPIPTELNNHVLVFIRRFSQLQVHSLNARVRFLCYLCLAYAVQHDSEHVAAVESQLLELQSSVKGSSSKTLLERTLNQIPQLL